MFEVCSVVKIAHELGKDQRLAHWPFQEVQSFRPAPAVRYLSRENVLMNISGKEVSCCWSLWIQCETLWRRSMHKLTAGFTADLEGKRWLTELPLAADTLSKTECSHST